MINLQKAWDQNLWLINFKKTWDQDFWMINIKKKTWDQDLWMVNIKNTGHRFVNDKYKKTHGIKICEW